MGTFGNQLAHQALTILAQKAPGGAESLFRNPFIPMIFIGVLFYFMLIRPETQRKAEHAKLVENLKKHDRVVTIGGICGTVSNAAKNSDELTLVVDENTNTKIRVLRSSISRVVTEKATAE